MLDDKMYSWRKEIDCAIPDERQSLRRACARLAVGEQSVSLKGHNVVKSAISTVQDDMVEALRATMPQVAWPVVLTYAIDFNGVLVLEEIRISGMELSRFSSNKAISRYTVDWGSRSESLLGLDALAQDFDLIASLSPPSNMPVRSWSTGHTIMGTPHIGHDGVYARSEPEVLIKLEWHRKGRDGLRKILENGGLEQRRNDDVIFFVASDLRDFDIDPEGSLPRKLDALDDLAKYLENLKSQDPEP